MTPAGQPSLEGRVRALETDLIGHKDLCGERMGEIRRRLEESERLAKERDKSLRGALAEHSAQQREAVDRVQRDVRGLYSRWWAVATAVIVGLFGLVGLAVMVGIWVERVSKAIGVSAPWG